MALYHIAKDALDKALSALTAVRDVIVPVNRGDAVFFSPLVPGEGACLEAGMSVIPPKDSFFPQTQTLLRFKNSNGLEITPEPATTGRPTLLAGVRPCDLRSFALLDMVFAKGQFVDGPYVQKRENTTIIALGCGMARSTCFCTSMGLSPAEAPGADVFLFPMGDSYAFETQTEKGEHLRQDMEALGFAVKPLDGADAASLAAVKSEALATVTLRVDPDGVSEALDSLFESGIWAEQSEKCLGCGVCSYVCPTCHCFDIQDESTGTEGSRIRCWDCCMFSDFTRMAGGHNPRTSKKERIRQRFMHKLRYFKVNNGELACVGCGRCMEKCPGGMDITEVIEEVKSRVQL